jgi:20S proteasome subunit alpha 2
MDTEINYSLTTFTSKGALAHCDRAIKAASNGSLALGIAAPNGIVLASFKKTPSSLVCREAYPKVFKVCETICATYAGLGADFRAVLETAREIAVEYHKVFGKYPYVDYFIKEFSKVMQEVTQKGGLRPFGCICLFGGYAPLRKKVAIDEEGKADVVETKEYNMQPLLFQIDPSGSIHNLFSSAIGSSYKEASLFLSKRCGPDIDLHDAVTTSVIALKEFTPFSLSEKDIDICTFSIDDMKIAIYSPSEVKEILQAI